MTVTNPLDILIFLLYFKALIQKYVSIFRKPIHAQQPTLFKVSTH